MVSAFDRAGWRLFPPEPSVAAWAASARQAAQYALADPANAHWYQCEGTWFVGVDALPSQPSGAISGTPLEGAVVRFIQRHLGTLPPLHPAQLSVIWPDYPRPRQGESAGAFRYRQKREAAHVDGLLPSGPDRRRRIAEPHAWILGLPLNTTDPDAAPLVLWEGSHRVIAAALTQALEPYPPASWGDVDITDAYQTARQKVFETCPRIRVHAAPGAAYLLHPLVLHGVSAWDAPEDPSGRMIAYFRPQIAGGVAAWLTV
ncbi:hypothetical protein [Thalassococcus sp. S3]|uniref:hypothetical protein n=1 Tax=Thalassococcus sp. S3 TaxID=2017482 RepID=UPI0010245A93|nr:hypothetical protein [Thalassococcus sp. S3]QBF33279.1 hypothetical protein CFI11_18915 [Thalassococcus sp. S3]